MPQTLIPDPDRHSNLSPCTRIRRVLPVRQNHQTLYHPYIRRSGRYGAIQYSLSVLKESTMEVFAEKAG
jgi:hypothetical protein